MVIGTCREMRARDQCQGCNMAAAHWVPTGTVTCEEPNSRMHHFVGSLEWNNRKYPLDIGNLLLRGCKIRNTDTCYGLVIYAGTAHCASAWGAEGGQKPA